MWKRVYFSPLLASLSRFGVGTGPAERAAHAEADVVEQDEQHVRAACRRLHRLRVARRRVLVRLADLALERGVGLGELRPLSRSSAVASVLVFRGRVAGPRPPTSRASAPDRKHGHQASDRSASHRRLLLDIENTGGSAHRDDSTAVHFNSTVTFSILPVNANGSL